MHMTISNNVTSLKIKNDYICEIEKIEINKCKIYYIASTPTPSLLYIILDNINEKVYIKIEESTISYSYNINDGIMKNVQNYFYINKITNCLIDIPPLVNVSINMKFSYYCNASSIKNFYFDLNDFINYIKLDTELATIFCEKFIYKYTIYFNDYEKSFIQKKYIDSFNKLYMHANL